ncbi:PREDICTED: centromere/kinetochore protein zw10 homolog isoform X3 [Nelumbo nucifera]|uniref:Centromere/kinetochore protein zw10 homolog isoform X3 n=1 Tax=Nelumbo nucifera TaxID=4432 RepID=A0A1U8Q2A9_NELNU|nr:PREDICTED: centromere/kinetochore protein zw10 homolog isoform X3 [Nelumbo nucifera]
MDVLFGSIDVRELLSVQEFDESSPLSAPDLRLLIDRLQVRSLQIKEKVRDYIISHHKDLSVIFTSCSEAVARTGDISEDVSNVIRLISDHPIDMEIRDIVDEINSKRKELKEKKEFLAIIQTVVNLVRRLTSVREDLKDGRLMDAAGAVRDLKKALPIHDEVVEKREPVVFGLLRKEWMDCFDEVREVLLGLLEDIISFEPESGIVRVKLQLTTVGTNAVDLRTVLTSMDVVDMLDYGFARVADLMVKYTIAPIVSNGCPAVSVEESDQDSGQMTEAILKLVPSSNSRVECMDGAAIYSEILQVIKFISKFICFENGQWMRCFGRLTWTRISELVISRFLSKAVPNDASKLAEFQRIIKLTSDFETGLKEMLFISASDSKDEKLSNFAQNVEVHFANRKKTEILAKARNLLLQCDFILAPEYTRKGPTLKDGGMDGNVAQHAVDLLFYPESCVVSKAASQLMELVHQTLKDVCLSSKRVAMEFYHAARDALLLYQAVIPVKYRSDFPSSVKEHAVFVDMAPSFHQMAEDILQKQIQLVNSNLTQAIDGADGFQNTHQMQQYESAKFSIDQVVFILEKVHIIWEPLLLPSTYKKSMCIVLEYVFSRMIKDVLLLDDMAAEETLELQRLIHLTVESLSSLFESLIAINEKKKSQEGFTSVQLEELLPSLRKLRKLADLLDMPLKSITTAWESGELVSCGFTSAEVQNFIKAIFTDSPLRKECLFRIECSKF